MQVAAEHGDCQSRQHRVNDLALTRWPSLGGSQAVGLSPFLGMLPAGATTVTELEILGATPGDAGTIHAFVLALARYERLASEVSATVDDIHRLLFGPRPYAEAVLARWRGVPVGFALFFHNVSTFAGQPGLFVEDLFVKPEFRRRGIGRALLRHLAGMAVARGCTRMEWMALDWNRPALDCYAALGARVRQGWVALRLDGDALTRLAAPSPSSPGCAPHGSSLL